MRCQHGPLVTVEAHLGGADGIKVHLREDRRHIQDADVRRLRDTTQISTAMANAIRDIIRNVSSAQYFTSRSSEVDARQVPQSIVKDYSANGRSVV